MATIYKRAHSLNLVNFLSETMEVKRQHQRGLKNSSKAKLCTQHKYSSGTKVNIAISDKWKQNKKVCTNKPNHNKWKKKVCNNYKINHGKDTETVYSVLGAMLKVLQILSFQFLQLLLGIANILPFTGEKTDSQKSQ